MCNIKMSLPVFNQSGRADRQVLPPDGWLLQISRAVQCRPLAKATRDPPAIFIFFHVIFTPDLRIASVSQFHRCSITIALCIMYIIHSSI